MPKFSFKPSWPTVDLGGVYDTLIGDPAHDIQTFVAETVYDTLDPVYGEGGSLEVVAVAVDPDRTVVEEYIEPVIETGQDMYETAVEKTSEAWDFGKIALITLGLVYLKGSRQ